MDKIKIIIIAVICFVIGYLIPKAPDVSVIHDKVFINTKTTGTTFITIKATAAITGATGATIKPNGETIVSGSNLSINTSSETSTKTITLVETQYKEIFSEKKIYQTAGIGIAFNPFNALNEFGAGGSVIVSNVQINAMIIQKDLFREIKGIAFIQLLF